MLTINHWEPNANSADWIARIRARPAVVAALATSRSDAPTRAFVPGPEHARWG